MAYWGCSFSFNGVNCAEHGLMLYDIGGSGDEESLFASTVEIEEELVGSQWKPHFIGVRYPEKLRISLLFGVDQRRIDESAFLTRREINEVSAWLTGHDSYMKLTINQLDMLDYYYKCICTSLSLVHMGKEPWAFRAEFTCDSPYAYMYSEDAQYTVNGQLTGTFVNPSGHNGYFMPVVTIRPTSSSFSIRNLSDGSREMRFDNLPGSVSEIVVDTERCLITNDQDLNLYENFNFKFLRLKRGENQLVFNGSGAVTIGGELPINIGS